MKMDIKQWFTYTHLDLYLSQIDFFLKGIQERVLPAFDDLDNDAMIFEQREFERLSEVVNPKVMNEADLAEIVRNMAINYCTSFQNVLQGMHNLLAVGMFHLFEQQVCTFNQAFQYGRPIRSFAQPAIEKCALLPSSTNARSSNAFCGTSACGRRVFH
ncbi:hypothetical protein SCARR_04269 [Pontiella sulfatireligans]|uniref:Uncharacterized protein n=1 Tax=Pontiella sulfatireligans TaxID=2750658 RepID=A0A6C2USI9_9BACT|nr:hypothetical protein SCARR_04269 [Pontiella sulfatireligans]